MVPNQIAPMWGLVIKEQQGTNQHAVWWASRDLDDESLTLFKEMLLGDKCAQSPSNAHLFRFHQPQTTVE
jgi:hypothetical protein